MENIDSKRVDILLDYIIKTSFANINIKNNDDRYDKIYDIYESLINRLFDNKAKDFEMDNLFLTENLSDMNEFEKQEVFSLAKKYSSVCFFQGNQDNWIDSPMGTTALNPELICKKILNDYDYLLKIAKNGKEDALRFLLEFKNSEIDKYGPIISVLRYRYNNDDLLENTILEMVKEDGKYKNFSTSQKVLLCTYPEGLLYKTNEKENFELIDVKSLENDIVKYYIGEVDDSFTTKSIIKGLDDKIFKEIIENMNIDYLKKHFEYKK